MIIEPRLQWRKWLAICVYGNAIVFAAIGFYFFMIPAAIIVQGVSDPAVRTGDMPKFVYRWHRELSEEYEPWARERIASGKAAEMSTYDISGTEWPLFGSVYYLWATEALQDAWEDDPTLAQTMPSEYARGAIEAAVALVIDPDHATWVKRYWGDDYLYTENVFYRMLYISGLTSYQKLLGDNRYEELLLKQIDTLSSELDASPYGLLDDYPGQCYPIDILPAIAAIQRADRVIGTDHSASIDRAVRAFEGSRLDPLTRLPAYIANSSTGLGIGPARGVGVSYMLIWLPELWPEKAKDWYSRYEQFFWQDSWLVVGVREFSTEGSFPEWYFADVDAGPVLNGFGTAASAFGIGATRANGRLDHAYPLSGQALIAAWPLANGTMLGARMLSNLTDAPYLGETALLFNFTRTQVVDGNHQVQGALPFVVYFGVLLYGAMGALLIGIAILLVRRWRKRDSTTHYPWPRLQLFGWSALILSGFAILMVINSFAGAFLLLLAQLLPIHYGKTATHDST